MKHTISNYSLIVTGIIGILLTTFFYNIIWRICIASFGILLIIVGISNLLYVFNGRLFKIEKLGFFIYRSIAFLTIGILLLIPWTNSIVQFIIGLVIGLYLLIESLIKLFKATDKVEQFKHDIFKYILGLLIITFGLSESGKFVVLAIFIVCFVYGLINYIIERKNTPKNKEYSDLKYEVKDTEE